jgi:transposase
VADQQRSVAETAGHFGLSWPTVHDAFVAHTAPLLDADKVPVAALGIDETRRGKQRWTFDADTLTWTPTADRFHTGFVDAAGDAGVLGHCDGRKAADVAAWLGEQPRAWRDAIRFVTIDMSRSYAKAAADALPHAQVVVDRFHVVALGNAMLTKVRQRLTRDELGRRGRTGDFVWRARRRLLTGEERLSAQTRERLVSQLQAAGHPGQVLLAAWQIKEQLRALTSLAARHPTKGEVREARRRLFTLIAEADIPEATGMARTIEAWWDGIEAGILTGHHNAKAEGYHRVAKTVARNAYGFRNPTNHQRRVRWACTRQHRRRTSTITPVPG